MQRQYAWHSVIYNLFGAASVCMAQCHTQPVWRCVSMHGTVSYTTCLTLRQYAWYSVIYNLFDAASVCMAQCHKQRFSTCYKPCKERVLFSSILSWCMPTMLVQISRLAQVQTLFKHCKQVVCRGTNYIHTFSSYGFFKRKCVWSCARFWEVSTTFFTRAVFRGCN